MVTEVTPNFNSNLATNDVVKQDRLKTDVIDEDRQKDWWSMEDHGAIMFNNQYPFYENHSIKVSYIYGERYLDKTVKEACIKLVAMDILMTDDYTVLFPEGTNNIDLNAKVQRLKLREKVLAKLDGIEMTEEEIDYVVDCLMQSSPNRIKLNNESQRLYKKMRG